MKTASPKMTKMTKFQQIKMRVAKMPTYRGQREKDIEVRIVKCIVGIVRNIRTYNNRDVSKTTRIFNKWVSRKRQRKRKDHLVPSL